MIYGGKGKDNLDGDEPDLIVGGNFLDGGENIDVIQTCLTSLSAGDESLLDTVVSTSEDILVDKC